jgi:hypothetical protein
MDSFLKKYNEIISNKDNVFRYCPRINCFIVLEKTTGTITNENRKYIIDSEFASYKANKLKLIMIIDVITTEQLNCSVEIPYRVSSRNFSWDRYEIGDIVGGDDKLFNEYTMYFGIPYFKSFKRVYHEYQFYTGTLNNITDKNGDYFVIRTFDSFGKTIIKYIDVNTNEDLFSLADMIDPIVVTINKKINKLINLILW